MTESDIQKAFFTIVKYKANRDKRWAWIHSVPNGGKRSLKTAVTMKAEGVMSGVWDVFVPVPVRLTVLGVNSGGMYIEFKRPKFGKAQKGRLTENQIAFAESLFGCYAFSVCYSAQEAIQAIEQYFTTGTGNYGNHV